MRDVAGSRVLVLGLGRSGRSAAAFLADRGARVTVADERAPELLGDLGALEGRVALHLGRPFPELAGWDLVVPSPGVARERWAAGAERVAGDVELAAEALSVPIAAITGTNGKSTATALLAAMLRAAGLRAETAGNIGRPVLELVGRPLDVAVVEVSSFQLEATRAFRPHAAVILNLAPDHLDRHGDFESYRDAKALLLRNQTRDDHAILNADDSAVRPLAERTRGQVSWFRTSGPVERGCFFDGGAAVLRDGAETSRILLEGWDPEAGASLEAVLACLAASRAFGVDAGKAALALPGFRPLPHRREVVACRGDVLWVNDSKATNPAAAAHALRASSRPLVWLAGGRGKGIAFDALIDAAVGRVHDAILFGESADALASALGARVRSHRVRDLDEAVRLAARLAQSGDAVLLSPACASFDQFRDFEERGERFRSAVAALPEAVR